MTIKRMLVALALVCAAMTGASTVVVADVVVSEGDGAVDLVGPVVLYVTDIPDDDPDGGLIVRSGPSTSTREIDVLDNGTAVTVVAWPVTGFFVEITEPLEGWVGVKYLTLDKPEQPIRQIDAQNARPAVETPEDVADQSELAPETLALDDESSADGVATTEDPETSDDNNGFPVVSAGIAVVLLAVMGMVLVSKKKQSEQSEAQAVPDQPEPEPASNNGANAPDALASELAERAARVQGKR